MLADGATAAVDVAESLADGPGLGVAALGVMFFAVFFVFYNIALAFTTAARGALALSTLPLWTMVVAALLGAEPLTLRKTSAY